MRVYLLTALAAMVLTACDPEGKEKCQWTLEPEPKLIGHTDPGLIPLCARNRETNHEDCRFQGTLEFARSAWTKKFRYVDIDADASKAPKVIRSIKYCDDSK